MTESLLENRRILWTVAALIIVLFATANLPWQLDDYDQAKQAFTSFEMVKEGHWFYQHTPHEHVATKPPLVGWISAGLFALTQSWEIAWRLPSFLAALLFAILLFRFAKEAYGSTAALIARPISSTISLALSFSSKCKTSSGVCPVACDAMRTEHRRSTNTK